MQPFIEPGDLASVVGGYTAWLSGIAAVNDFSFTGNQVLNAQ